jgi:cytochrome c
MKSIITAISAMALVAISGAAFAADPVELTKQFGGDCLACHSVDHKVVGPAWKDVAAKYKGQAGAHDMLVAKVIKGGNGNWNKVTGGISMAPHPSKPSKEEIGKIVDAILKL